MWKVSHLMTVMRPCTAAGKEPKALLWACDGDAVLSVVKWDSFQRKALTNVQSIDPPARCLPFQQNRRPHVSRNRKWSSITMCLFSGETEISHWHRTLSKKLQNMSTCQVMCFTLWQLRAVFRAFGPQVILPNICRDFLQQRPLGPFKEMDPCHCKYVHV